MPAYRRLAERLRADLDDGLYPPGQQLPTEAELMEREGASRHTIRQALRELVAQGLVYRVAGRGTFPVARDSRTRSLRVHGALEDMFAIIDATQQLILAEAAEVDAPEAAAKLGVADGRVVEVRGLRLDDGLPFSYFQAWIDPAIVALLSADAFTPGVPRESTVAGVVGSHLGRPPSVIDQTINAAGCPGHVAGYLGLEPGQPCLSIDRLFRDRDGGPLVAMHAYHN